MFQENVQIYTAAASLATRVLIPLTPPLRMPPLDCSRVQLIAAHRLRLNATFGLLVPERWIVYVIAVASGDRVEKRR